MHKRATVQEIMLPHTTTVTPNEGTEGTEIPHVSVTTNEFRAASFATGLPAHPGIAPWDDLWDRSNAKPH